MDGDVDLVGVPGERFVHGVVHHFVHQVMQAELTGRADIHGRAFAHRLHAAEHLNRVSVVITVGGFTVHFFGVFNFGLQFFRGHSAP